MAFVAAAGEVRRLRSLHLCMGGGAAERPGMKHPGKVKTRARVEKSVGKETSRGRWCGDMD